MPGDDTQPSRGARLARQRAARARLLRDHSAVHLALTAVATGLALVLFAEPMGAVLGAVWLALLVLLGLGQAVLIRAGARRDSAPAAIAGTADLLLACTLVSAVAWGLLGGHLSLVASFAHCAMFAVLGGALIAAALATLGAMFGAFALYVALVAGPLTGGLLLEADPMRRTLGALVLISVGAALLGGWRHAQAISRTLALEIDCEEMCTLLRMLQARLPEADGV